MKHRFLTALCFTLFIGIFIGSCSASKLDMDSSAPENADARQGAQQDAQQDARQEESAMAELHPAFDIGLSQLKALLEEEPEDVRRKILERPDYFLELISRAMKLPECALVLVDKEHSLPETYAPDDLINLKDYDLSLNRDTLQLSRACMPAVLAMTEAARIDGIEMVFSSTYRPYEYQKMLYENYVAKYGQEEADRFSARPGTSQHQLGTTIDFGSITPEFGDTPAGKWLYEHAWEYGFSLSYPEAYEDVTGYMFEIWHYRYITTTGTRLEREFFSGIQQYMTEFLHRNGEYLKQALIEK